MLRTKATMFLAFLVLGLLKRPAHRYLQSVYVETCRNQVRPKFVCVSCPSSYVRGLSKGSSGPGHSGSVIPRHILEVPPWPKDLPRCHWTLGVLRCLKVCPRFTLVNPQNSKYAKKIDPPGREGQFRVPARSRR